ncbi:MAG: hypothetical protein K9I36_12100 [Bacteroidia bacterium]|nr:hypothetical protein [Bacteroidia bacterium]MCF8427468.1 hypothetical protein [Bacteroidia bacterium]
MRWFIFLVGILLNIACNQVQVEIRNVPENTPTGAQVYITGNFNNWNPGDPNYLMKYDEVNKRFYAKLPVGFGEIAYKFTRGDWTTVEADSCGGDIENRSFTYGSSDSSINYISGWSDLAPVYCGRLTIVLDKIPEKTPKGSPIFLSGNVNYWILGQADYRFKKGNDGKYFLTVPRREDKLIFKINRGTWESIEVDANNQGEESRVIKFGEEDTIHLVMRNWIDLPNENPITKTICIKNLPKETPANCKIYLSGSFNNWNPMDESYLFKKNAKGEYYINYLFSENDIEEYKITRGGWERRELKLNKEEMKNRVLTKDGKDTQILVISRWADQQLNGRPNSTQSNPPPPEIPKELIPVEVENPYAGNIESARKIIFILDKVPEPKSKNERIYLTGDFNDWVTDMPGFDFKLLPNGKRYLVLRLNDKRTHEFKITRGDWSNEASDLNRNKWDNKTIPASYGDDTIHLKIESWVDRIPSQRLVIVIEDVPQNTPPQSTLYLSGNFNGWLANVQGYQFKKLNGKYYLTLPEFNENYQEYKITRGDWNNEFANSKGRVLSNQKFKKHYENDTLSIRIAGWVDLPAR